MRDKLPSFIDRKIVVSHEGCWLWSGARDLKGYGVTARGKVHRVAYVSCIGEPEPGLVLDHLCRVRHCCNPAHMEPVTNRENILRGEGLAAQSARKTHCVHGHSLDDAYISKKGHRYCRECHRARRPSKEWNRAYQAAWRTANRDKCRAAQERHKAKRMGV